MLAIPHGQEIARNYCLLKPVCVAFPTKARSSIVALSPRSLNSLYAYAMQVPSPVFLADTFLQLDTKLGGGLLIPKPNESKGLLAAREAARVKKLMGALRYLYRNGDKSKSDRVSELKQLLRRSPRRIVTHLAFSAQHIRWHLCCRSAIYG